ncbi:MAG: hypothetical protein NT062_04405 [Proteobacteria bacterium]|nr:hypothetical protein [Pseudomonadota bacterium]
MRCALNLLPQRAIAPILRGSSPGDGLGAGIPRAGQSPMQEAPRDQTLIVALYAVEVTVIVVGFMMVLVIAFMR